jgi:hypothetical protein
MRGDAHERRSPWDNRGGVVVVGGAQSLSIITKGYAYNKGCTTRPKSSWARSCCLRHSSWRSGSGQATRESRAETTILTEHITGPIGQLTQVNFPRTSAKGRATATRPSGLTLKATTLLILVVQATITATPIKMGAKCRPRCQKATGCGHSHRPSSTGPSNFFPMVDRTGRTRIPTRRPFWTLSMSFRS